MISSLNDSSLDPSLLDVSSSSSSSRLLEFAHSSSCGLGSNEWDNFRVSIANCNNNISRRRKRRRKIGVVVALESWSSRRDFESLASSSS